ncbi:MAG: hypothetical protein ACYT04_90550, partial [Nostoc sp.]
MPHTSLREAAPTTTLLRPFFTRRYANGKAQGNASLSTSQYKCPIPHTQKLHPKSGWSFLSES